MRFNVFLSFFHFSNQFIFYVFLRFFLEKKKLNVFFICKFLKKWPYVFFAEINVFMALSQKRTNRGEPRLKSVSISREKNGLPIFLKIQTIWSINTRTVKSCKILVQSNSLNINFDWHDQNYLY